jgi:SAM-dependent methyltransferase
VCRERDFATDWYHHWRTVIGRGVHPLPPDQVEVWGKVGEGMEGRGLHRKLWEWAAVSQALSERGMLAPGRLGLGFAVGQEPLASLFAAHGCRVTASDYPTDSAGWSDTGQVASSLQDLHWPNLIRSKHFNERVDYRVVDMRDLSQLPREHYDFAWSACSFEHLGSLSAGLDFVRDCMACLAPGGVAVHTTEFNISSDEATVAEGGSVLYRRRDLEGLACSLRRVGCAIEHLDFEPGWDPHDLGYDEAPFYSTGREHVKLLLGGFVTTSILLIVRKGPAADSR